MGFDFYMRRVPVAVPEDYVPYVEGHPEYYQVSNQGAALLVDAMRHARVLDEEMTAPDFDWDWPPGGLDSARVEEILDALNLGHDIEPPVSGEERNIIEAQREREEAVFGTRSQALGRVPGFKFSTNDGWIVHADESENIANGLKQFSAMSMKELMADSELARRIGENEVVSLLKSWGAFNALAASHDGYCVR